MSPQKSSPDLPDRRLWAYRPDLADVRLAETVRADRYVAGETMRVCAAVAPMHREPRPDSMRESEALFGDDVWVFERQEGWAWCQNQRDGYVGYIAETAVAAGATPQLTHCVPAIGGALVFAGPDIKSQLLMRLPLNARLTVSEEAGAFARLGGHVGGWVRLNQIHPWDGRPGGPEFASVAESFLGTPYLWGGCTRDGIDCSGLVQMSMLARRTNVGRDSDMQEAGIGSDRDAAGNNILEQLNELGFEGPVLKRGDLVFWPGHVGIMVDAVRLVHANAHHMCVTIEPLEDVAHRSLVTSNTSIRSIKRF